MIDYKNINPLGDGLTIIINCDYTIADNWLAFASWYSIKQNLPDAKVKIFCKRGFCNYQIFNWPNRCQVPFSFSSPKEEENCFIISSDALAVDSLDFNNIGPIDCKSNEKSTFVSVSCGCGKFDFEKHKNFCPFSLATKLFSDNLTLNEYRVLKIWDKANRPYIGLA